MSTPKMPEVSLERRQEPRYPVAVVTKLDEEPDGAVGMARDLSSNGARMLCIDPLQQGQKVDLWFLTPKTEEVRASGRVVRAERFEGSGPWRYVVGIRLEHPLEQVPEQFAGNT